MKQGDRQQAELKRLDHVVSLRRSLPNGDLGQRPYVGLANIEATTGRLASTTERLQPHPRPGRTAQDNIFEPGDVLFGKLRPSLAKAWVAEFPGRCTPELLVMQPHGIEPRFLLYVCLSPNFVEAANAFASSSLLPRVSWKTLGELPIPIPERQEQLSIAAFLDRQASRINTLVEAKHHLLGLLAERRRALAASPRTEDADSRIDEIGELEAETRRTLDLLKERRAALISAAVNGQLAVEAA